MIKQLSASPMTNYREGAIKICPNQLARNVDLRPFAIEHEMQRHPLFQLGNLVELAKRLPPQQREYVFAKQEFGTHDNLDQYKHAAENDDLSTEELINAIEHQNIVIVLRNIETDDIYGQFVNNCLDSLGRIVEPITGPISGRESFVFVSPPNAYTPYHWDPEQNFFLQLRGRKQMAIYDVNNREILPEAALEKYYTEGQKISQCTQAMFDQYELFDMKPGDGVYVPVTAPHWVRTLDEVSISVSINFRSPSSVRRDRVFRLNSWMRRFGMRPNRVSPRANSWSDRTKSMLLGIPAQIKRMVQA